MDRLWHYVSGVMGMTSSGSFTRDRRRWITFTEHDRLSLEGRRPYGATKRGVFVLAVY